MECMRKYLLLALIALNFSGLGQSGIECPQDLLIEYQNDGNICFDFGSFLDFTENKYTLVLYLSNNTTVRIEIRSDEVGFTTIFCSTEAVDAICENFGVYSLTSEDGIIICEGFYEIDNPSFYHNNLKFSDECVVAINGEVLPNDCASPLNLQIDHFPHFVCIGDTTHIDILDGGNNFPPIGTFNPSDIEFQNGQIISFTEYSFDVVWNNLGEDCLIYTTRSGCDEAARISVVTVLDKESMKIQVDGTATQSIDICVDEKIELTSAFNYEQIKWVSSTNLISNDQQYAISFSTPGTYHIILDNDSECNCTIPDTLLINVLAGATPGIDCVGTICSESEVTYYSEQECDTYVWSISANGTITDGGGMEDFFATVLWNSGPIGELTLTTPSCSTSACRETVTEIIPIIDGTAEISGPTTACFGSYQNYSIPDYEGSEIVWDIDWQDGRIVSGRYTNEITVQWANSGNPLKTITVTYDNCYLECSGMAELEVMLVENIYINIDQYSYCEDETIYVSNTQSQAVDWTVTYPDLTTQKFTNLSILSLTSTQIGKHKILLEDISGNSCNLKDSTYFQISPPPTIPTSINGPTNICKGELATYTVEELGSYQNVYWEIYDGSLVSPTSLSSSKTLSYIWISDGPYQISAQIEDALSGCIGENLILPLVNNLEVVGADIVCIYDLKTYELANYNSGEIVWSINPPTAGNVVNIDGNTIDVVWIEYGIHELNAEHCNFDLSIEVEVPYEDFTVTWEPPCYGETTSLDIMLPVGSSFEVWDSLRNVIAIADTVMVSQGKYTIHVTTKDGCQLSDTIDVIERNQIGFEIASNPILYCPSGPDLTLTCTDLGLGSTYQWYLNDNLINTTNVPFITWASAGNYKVIAQNNDGCQFIANILVFCCAELQVPPFTVTKDKLDCYDYQFEIIPPYQSTEFNWYIGSNVVTPDNSTGTLLSYTFPKAGCYSVGVVGNYYEILDQLICEVVIQDTVYEYDSKFVCIGVRPYFTFKSNCVDQPIDFKFNPEYYDVTATFTHEYNFGDPSSGINNTSTDFDPTHTYSSSGEYTVTLTMTESSTGCQYVNSRIVTVTDFPQIEIIETIDPCQRGPVLFSINTSDPNLRYSWEFGDSLSVLPNTSTSASPTHLYLKDSTYTVTLTAINSTSCKTTITKEITITTPTFEGEITSNSSYPKCPEDFVTLSAPMGGQSYLWSTAEISSQISTYDEGTYTVTITYADSCTYTPPPHYVYDFDLGDAVIRGVKHSPVLGEPIYHYDTITVCHGVGFDVEVTSIPDVSYSWNPGSASSRFLSYSTHFSSLDPGTYIYYVEVTQNTNGCTGTIGPFVIEIIEPPEQPILVSSDSIPCEENFVTLSISNPDPSLSYKWNTGSTGIEISGASKGYYFVIASNAIGCKVESNGIFVSGNPTINQWMTGCYEVCFPDTMCIRLSQSSNYQYQLIKNGVVSSTLLNNSDELVIDGPGDYQLMLTAYGCSDTTDILTLNSAPIDHTLMGIVFLDENENGIYDGIDMLLEDIPVTLYNGNTAINDTLTDISGGFLFDSLSHSNLTAIIDPSNTGYTLSGDLDSILLYDNCLEDKIINFPLIPDCQSLIRDTTYMVCDGSSIEIGGTIYYPNEIDTLRFPVSMNCDSVVAFNILSSPDPEVILTIDSTCVGEDNGAININNVLSLNLHYSLDSNPTLFTDTMIDGLSTGLHTLYIFNDFGCETEVPFTVPELSGAEVMITPFGTCLFENNGYISIDVSGGENLSFALDGSSNYTTDLIIEDIYVGNHSLHILDENGCEYQQGFVIPLLEDPIVTVSTQGICPPQEFGNAFIEIVSGENLLFSLFEEGPYESKTYFDGLVAGVYTVYIQDESNCTHYAWFEIEAYPEINYSLWSSIICAEEMYGTLSISNISDGLSFSLDGIEYQQTNTLDSITPGVHPLYILSENGCTDTTTFYIQHINNEGVTFITTDACQNLSGGVLQVDSTWSFYKMAVDDLDFENKLVFEELTPGEHILYVQGDKNCVTQLPFTIIEHTQPQIEIDTYNTCSGDNSGSIIIHNISGTDLIYSIDGVTYSSLPSIDSLTTNQYTLYVLSPEDCTYAYPFTIEDYSDFVATSTSINNCFGESNGMIIIDDTTDIIELYINDVQVEISDTISNLSEGSYTVDIIDINGCQIRDTLTLQTLPELIIEIADFDPDCLSNSLTISPNIISHNGPLQYQWSTGATSESIAVNESGRIELLIRDQCSEFDYTWDLTFDNNNSSDLIHIPNIFSPNGDGSNDCFTSTLDPRVDLVSYNQLIFDRWGNLMFNSNDINRCWDGTYQGGEVVTGVFVYITDMVVSHCVGLQDVRKVGDVTVLR